MNRMARPSRPKPSVNNRTPLAAAVSVNSNRVAISRWSGMPLAASLVASVPVNAAVMAQVDPSAPPMAKGRELHNAVTAPPIAPVMNVAVSPKASQGVSGPEKISAA